MKFVTMIRGLGVLSICVAAASFLMEGWQKFNGLEKFMLFFGFVFVLFIMAEVFRRSAKVLSQIFYSLTIALTPAISAQLGSYLYDGKLGAVQSSSPLQMIYFFVILLLVLMIRRAFRSLGSGRMTLDLLYTLGSFLLFLIPVRTSEFHAQMITLLFLGFLLVEKKSVLAGSNRLVSNALRLSPLIILLGRAGLYQIDSSLYLCIYLVLSIACFFYIPVFVKEETPVKYVHTLGYASLVLFAHQLGNFGYWSDYLWTILLTELCLLGCVLRFQLSRKTGFVLMSVFAWVTFLITLMSSQPLKLLEVGSNLILPAAIMALAVLFKSGSTFANSAVLLVSVLTWLTVKIVELPIINLWMVFAAAGLTLLVPSALVENPHHKILGFWDRTKNFFNHES